MWLSDKIKAFGGRLLVPAPPPHQPMDPLKVSGKRQSNLCRNWRIRQRLLTLFTSYSTRLKRCSLYIDNHRAILNVFPRYLYIVSSDARTDRQSLPSILPNRRHHRAQAQEQRPSPQREGIASSIQLAAQDGQREFDPHRPGHPDPDPQGPQFARRR